MNEAGKVIILLSLILFAGCIGAPTEGYVTEGESTPIEGETPPTQPEEVETEEPGCEASYEFSELPATGTIGQATQFSVTATCAMGKIIALNIDAKQETGGMISSNDPVTFNFVLMPEVEGTKQLSVWSDYDAVYNEAWEVLPIGSTDISGNKNDAASVKEWIATSFEIEDELAIRSVGAYMKRLYSQTMQNSKVVVDIRPDDGGKPGDSYMALVELPITDTTMTENWIYFNFMEEVELDAGKYWVVFRVTQETQDQIVSDVVNVHYTFGGDTTVPGNDYTRKMTLEWDNTQRRFVATDWQELSYDRTYSVIVSAEEH